MSGLRFSVKADLKEVEAMASDVQRNRVPVAAARALNKTILNVRTEAASQIKQERGLKASVIKDAMSVHRASRSDLTASLTATGKPIPLREYQARQTRAGVTVRVSPGGRKLVRHAGNSSFIVSSIGGHVFARQGKKRFPIKKLYGPSIPSTFLKEKIVEAMGRVAGDSWPKRFQEELNYELEK